MSENLHPQAEPALAALERLVRELAGRYGERAVRAEIDRFTLEALAAQSGEVIDALNAADLDALLRFPPYVFAGLVALSKVPSAGLADRLLVRLDIRPELRPSLLIIWHETRAGSVLPLLDAAITRILAGPDEPLLDESALALLKRRLEQQQEDILPLREQLLVALEPTLSALQQDHLTGHDVAPRLLSLMRVEAVGELLSYLVDQLDPNGTPTSHATPPFSVSALKYLPLLRFFRDVRLAANGRINHWVNIKIDRYHDLDTTYPQLEVRLFAYSKEILHTKDDLDDILRLGLHLIQACTDTFTDLHESGRLVPLDMTRNLADQITILEQAVTKFKQTLLPAESPTQGQ
jgi:hypothetical protein